MNDGFPASFAFLFAALLGFVLGVLFATSGMENYARIYKDEAGYFCTFNERHYRLTESK